MRRVARTIYMGSAPRPDGSRGVDLKSVVLGCVQPGEPITRFPDALRRLSGRATHLYVDGALYWYSLKPNVTRIAADRASNFADFDADHLVYSRLNADRRRDAFVGVNVFPEGPGDVPDEDNGVRLVVIDPSSVHHPSDGGSPAIRAASKLLAQRSAGPRFHRNMLVFVAASAPRLEELRAAARMHLAWKSIADEAEVLQLTLAQQRQVETKLAESKKTVKSRIEETFIYILTPWQEPGEGDVQWRTTRPSGTGSLPERVANKLRSEEKLVPEYSAVRVRMNLDEVPLWSDRGDIEVSRLWSAYTDFIYMPRLTGFDVLAGAIAQGPVDCWTGETFAYAVARKDDGWVGVQTNRLVTPARSGLLLRPDVVPPPPEKPLSPGEPPETGPEAAPGGPSKDEPEQVVQTPGFFYAKFDLNAVRGIHQLQKIMSEITNHLGEDVRLTLEIEPTARTASTNESRGSYQRMQRTLVLPKPSSSKATCVGLWETRCSGNPMTIHQVISA